MNLHEYKKVEYLFTNPNPSIVTGGEPNEIADAKWLSDLCRKLVKAITAGYHTPTPVQGVAQIVVGQCTYYLLAVVKGTGGIDYWFAKPGEKDVEMRYFTAAEVKTAGKVYDALPIISGNHMLSYYYDAAFSFPEDENKEQYEQFPINMINMHPGMDLKKEFGPGFIAANVGTQPVLITFYNGHWYCYKGSGSIFQAQQRGQDKIPVKRVDYKSISIHMNLHRYPALRVNYR